MAIPVMEFQLQGYKIRKIFATESTSPKEIIEFWEFIQNWFTKTKNTTIWHKKLPHFLAFCTMTEKFSHQIIRQIVVFKCCCFFNRTFNFHLWLFLGISAAWKPKNFNSGIGFNIKVFLSYSEKVWVAEIWIYLLKIWCCHIWISNTVPKNF